ncbi:ankyrin repeat-containing protein At2g01680-like [Solanum tuberosum]|uniref:ankyrin repeat-containing protein At2g01680-like n=1 Tax=Solanum tuberosum TaxID=4113 RepID=UPI00073A0772|nr:PREDICTED: ankyrin repeat-containing protein At2g01680-like [Solanum tuberosum]
MAKRDGFLEFRGETSKRVHYSLVELMDRRLWEAAQKGDVHHFQSLIKEDPLLLREVSLAGSETPLHIACSGGHLEFTKEIIHLRPEFARKLNQDGFSPLHIASANEDIEIVKELLNVDRNLCLIKGKDRRIPLHYAVINGRENVMKELLVVSPDSTDEVTARGETCLHLAVKNHQFEAFKFLLDNLKDLNKYGLLNKKDIQGNTVLHLAVSTKQYEVVNMLLDENVVCKGTIEMNSLNKKGLTPLEVLLEECGDRDIEEILRASGALSAENLQVLVVPVQDPSNEQSSREQRRDQRRSNFNKYFFGFNKTRDCPGKVSDTILVIAILIATATFQAGFNPPGGLWQDTYWPDDNNNSTSYDGIVVVPLRHFAGQSVMATSNPVFYGFFLVFNSLGFFVSFYMICFLTIGFPFQLELHISLSALGVTYFIVIVTTLPFCGIFFFFFIFFLVFLAPYPFISGALRNYCKKPRILS